MSVEKRLIKIRANIETQQRNYNKEQKMSFINLLIKIFSFRQQRNPIIELFIINFYTVNFNVSLEECFSYLVTFGTTRIITDLSIIDERSKEMLLFGVYEAIVITCQERSAISEILITESLFKQIGVSDAKFEESIRKPIAFSYQIAANMDLIEKSKYDKPFLDFKELKLTIEDKSNKIQKIYLDRVQLCQENEKVTFEDYRNKLEKYEIPPEKIIEAFNYQKHLLKLNNIERDYLQ